MSTVSKIPSINSKYTVQIVTKYMCRNCGQQFDTTQDMEAHVESHNRSNPPHSCYICGKTYRTPSKLRRHVRVHSGERPYACSLCDRRFTRSDHVKQHMKVHLPQRQKNTCRLCGLRFAKQQTLRSHLQGHGISEIAICDWCGEAFGEESQLDIHRSFHLRPQSNDAGESNSGSEQSTSIKKENPCEMGVARFCVSQIGAFNVKKEMEYDPLQNMEIPVLDVDNNRYDERESDIMEQVNNVTSPKMSISACFSLAASGQDVDGACYQDMNADTASDSTKMFMLPSSSETGEAKDEDFESRMENGNRVKKINSRVKVKLEPKTTEENGGLTLGLTTPSTSSSFSNHCYFRRTSASNLGHYHPVPLGNKKLHRCEFCSIWFEDLAMSMLHNSLHFADETEDPFTCKKCLKRLGNRLEFTAHLVWHLEPDMH